MSLDLIIKRFDNLVKLLIESRIAGLFSDEFIKRIIDAYASLSSVCNYSYEPMVSIIVPTRNEASRLPAMLKSVLNTCHRNFEVVVVDYESTDGTVDIAKAFGARVVKADRAGIGYASYLGVLESRGEVIIRTDADAIFTRDIVKRAVESLKGGKYVAHFGHVYYDGGFIENLIAYYHDKYIRRPWETTGSFIAIRRDLVERGVNFDPSLPYHEDYAFGNSVYKRFGPKVFAYDYYKSYLISARRIRSLGMLRYTFGLWRRSLTGPPP